MDKKDNIALPMIILILLLLCTAFMPTISNYIFNSIPKKEIIREYTYTEKGTTYKVTIEKIN